MELNCPNCRRPLHPDDVDLQTSIAKCGPCARVFHVYDQVRGATEGREKPLPSVTGLVVKEGSNRLKILSPWPRRVALAALLIVGGFVVAAVLSFRYAMLSEAPDVSSAHWSNFLVSALSAGGALVFGFFATTGLRRGLELVTVDDRAELRVADGWVVKRHRLRRDQIEQLYVVENGSAFDVMLLDDQRQTRRILSGVPGADVAVFFERKIELFLGIKDRRVDGERA